MTTELVRWGGGLPSRGREIVRLLCGTANVTMELRQRMGDAERLGEMLGLTPHFAWRLACDAAIKLGFGPTGREAWWHLVRHDLPGGDPPAEAWLRAAGLEDDGTWVNP